MQSIIEPVANQFRDDLRDDVYFRFNVEKGFLAVKTFDYEDLEIVRREYSRCQFLEHVGGAILGVYFRVRSISIQHRGISPQFV